MEKAWATLEELGAIDMEGKLTHLGRYMVSTRFTYLQAYFFLISLVIITSRLEIGEDANPGIHFRLPRPNFDCGCMLIL